MPLQVTSDLHEWASLVGWTPSQPAEELDAHWLA